MLGRWGRRKDDSKRGEGKEEERGNERGGKRKEKGERKKEKAEGEKEKRKYVIVLKTKKSNSKDGGTNIK